MTFDWIMQHRTWWGHVLARAVSHQPLSEGPQVQSKAVHVGYVVDQVILGQSFFLVFPVSIIPLVSTLILSSNTSEII
jgi:hypothetical protein